MINFTVHIKPMGAVRTTQRGKWTNEAYQRYQTYKKVIWLEARKQIKKPLQGAVIIQVNSYHPIPTKFNKDKKNSARNGIVRPMTKPDVDNIAKGIMDSLNKLAWEDDNQVISLSANKYYSDDPRVEISIEEVEVA